MSRRALAVSAAALLAALLLTTTVALAATTRTAATPDQLRAGHAAYEKSVARGWTRATKLLDAQLAKHPKKPTVVLDVDETTLSNWACLDAADFQLTGLATCVVTSRSVAFGAAKAFIRHARARKVAIAFITGAPQAACALRRQNLLAQGIRAPFTLVCRPPSDTKDSVVPYKSAQRRRLIAKGATIVLNVGDQRSDLAGGGARATLRLPNPVYVIA
jgi:predicted secreted acid phosphatase